MRIFERLRGKNRDTTGIERKLVDAVVADPLRQMDDQGPLTILADPKPHCCSCCAATADES